jgi:hypothetical protein
MLAKACSNGCARCPETSAAPEGAAFRAANWRQYKKGVSAGGPDECNFVFWGKDT